MDTSIDSDLHYNFNSIDAITNYEELLFHLMKAKSISIKLYNLIEISKKYKPTYFNEIMCKIYSKENIQELKKDIIKERHRVANYQKILEGYTVLTINIFKQKLETYIKQSQNVISCLELIK